MQRVDNAGQCASMTPWADIQLNHPLIFSSYVIRTRFLIPGRPGQPHHFFFDCSMTVIQPYREFIPILEIEGLQSLLTCCWAASGSHSCARSEYGSDSQPPTGPNNPINLHILELDPEKRLAQAPTYGFKMNNIQTMDDAICR